MGHVIAASRQGYAHLPEELKRVTGEEFVLIDKRADFTLERLESLQPEYVFLPHWSYLIPREIHERFECVIFHMTDLPFGRGGSPLQNLISRGIYQTQLSALRCVEELDAGPIYLKRPLSLHGNADEIFLRGAALVKEMIITMLRERPVPQPQQGEVVTFSRRRPEQSDISELCSLEQIYDYIRMLDADGYPCAYVDVGRFRFEFSRAALTQGEVVADVRIRERADDE